MTNKIHYLDNLVQKKQIEVDELIASTNKDPQHPLNDVMAAKHNPSVRFAQTLRGPRLAVIGEVKRRSPSLGSIGDIGDPVALAKYYRDGGASAISVLTDKNGFGGSLEDLRVVSASLAPLPTLRKEFILHPLQLAEAKLAGAAAALLIVRVVKKELAFLLSEAKRLGIETVTEVNNQAELEMALEAGAPIIAVNHRNLDTFEVDIRLSNHLRPLIPAHVVSVAASGIHTPDQAHQMRALGYDAILVGEALVRSTAPGELIAQMIGGAP